MSPGRARWRIVGLWAVAVATLGAATFDYDTPPGGQPCTALVSGLAEVSAIETVIDPALSPALPHHRVAMHLRHASLAGQRQALTTVLGCWWVRPEGALEGTVLTRSPTIAPHGVEVHLVSSNLVHRPDLDVPIHQLLQPWLGPLGGIGYDADSGTWTFSLDAEGQARIVQVLALLEHHQACCPGLLADPESPDPGHRLAGPVGGATWDALAASLADAAGMSVALGPGLPPEDAAPGQVAGTTIATVIQGLHSSGCVVTIHHGVACLDRVATPEGEHPAQHRLLALIPIGELITDEVDGTLLAQQFVRVVDPPAWTQPGAGLHFLAPERSLLAGGDALTLHHLLDAIDVIDTLGLEDGLRTLVAHQTAAPPVP